MTEIMAHAHPELGLIASEAMVEKWKAEIGTKPLNLDRKATIKDEMDPEVKIAGGTVKKELLTDRDIREITVGEIDEKMLDLMDADQSSPATTMAYNDLRDVKDAIINLNLESGLSYFGTAEKKAAELAEEGKSDEAEVMLAAAHVLQETADRPFQGTEHTPEENVRIVQDNLVAHNQRVLRNAKRSQ